MFLLNSLKRNIVFAFWHAVSIKKRRLCFSAATSSHLRKTDERIIRIRSIRFAEILNYFFQNSWVNNKMTV